MTCRDSAHSASHRGLAFRQGTPRRSSALGIAAISSGGLRAVLGYWLISLAANYVPLSAHAVSLIRPRALETELRGVDIPSELRHYTTAQLWVVVPLLMIVLAVDQWRRAVWPTASIGPEMRRRSH